MRSWITKAVVIPDASEAIEKSQTAIELAQKAVDDLGSIPQYVRTGADGVTITDGRGASVMRITSSSVSIGTSDGGEADGFSQFAAAFARFSDYYIRRTKDGGLAFSKG